MKIQIRSKYSGAVMFDLAAETLGAAVLALVSSKANLESAGLKGANLRNADLRDANFRDADLRDANFRDAILEDTDLRNADLRNADLKGANLRNANFRGAILEDTDLRNADLRDAVLRGVDLRSVDLRGANLRGANLRDANFQGVDLQSADLSGLVASRTILAEGDLIGWKKLKGGVICKLCIPAQARRVGGLVSRKCRAEFADVLEGEGKSFYDGTEYKVGTRMAPDKYDPNPLVDCAHGIHFYITREEAETYQ